MSTTLSCAVFSFPGLYEVFFFNQVLARPVSVETTLLSFASPEKSTYMLLRKVVLLWLKKSGRRVGGEGVYTDSG